MNDEDVLIERLKMLRPDRNAQKRECARAVAAFEPVARKARWAYTHYLRRTGQTSSASADFVRKYLAGWRDSSLYHANGIGRLRLDVPAERSHTLFACW